MSAFHDFVSSSQRMTAITAKFSSTHYTKFNIKMALTDVLDLVANQVSVGCTL